MLQNVAEIPQRSQIYLFDNEGGKFMETVYTDLITLKHSNIREESVLLLGF